MEGDFTNFIDDLPLAQRQNLIFHQDGATPHNIRAVQDFLNNEFPEWIGRNGRIRWPASSYDLTPLDIFLWDYLKGKVYEWDIQDPDQIRELIRVAINELNQNFPEFLRNTINGLRRRFEKCIEVRGDRFEHLLRR